MKKLVPIIVLAAILCLSLISCDKLMPPKEDVVEVIDGYVVVNGVKTDIQAKDESSSQPDKKDDVIEVVDGYLVVNGVKTGYQVKTNDVIEIVDGYVVVNGVKTDIYVPSCNHSWTTVTTNPTCAAGGYDTLTCSLCGKSVKENETAKLEHIYNTVLSIDEGYHWYGCTGCDATKDKSAHTPDDDNNCTVCGAPLSDTPGIVYDISADGSFAEVIDYNGTATKVKIAKEYQGLPVKSVYDYAFSGKAITSVIIPDSVTNIGNSAFKDCSSLSSVTIPSGVTNIGNSAFENCSINSITLPDTLTNIGDSAFCGCRFSSVIIPDSTTRIGSFAFAYTNITSIHIGSGVTNIGYGAFYWCNGLKIASISDLDAWCRIVFEYDQYDNMPEHNNTMSPTYYTNALYLNGEIVTDIVIPGDVTKIYPAMFINYTALQSITIPSGVTEIGFRAFYGCTSITSVVIPDGVKDLSYAQFSGCTGLRYVTIGNGVEGISGSTFANCSDELFTEYENGLYVGDAQNPYAIFCGVTQSNLSRYTIHSDTKIIAAGAFWDCTRVSTITIPEGVRSIGRWAFYNCTNLSTVIIPKSITTSITFGFYYNCGIKDVYYTGSEQDWNKIYSYDSDSAISYATKHFNHQI